MLVHAKELGIQGTSFSSETRIVVGVTNLEWVSERNVQSLQSTMQERE